MTERVPILTATFSNSSPHHCRMAHLTLREVRVLQPGCVAVSLAEGNAHGLLCSWSEACAAPAIEGRFGQRLRRRLKACCGVDMSYFEAGWPQCEGW